MPSNVDILQKIDDICNICYIFITNAENSLLKKKPITC